MASLGDETPEGRSIVELARNQGQTAQAPKGAESSPSPPSRANPA
jgi:K+-transporting ATPase ATPase B chain